MGILIGVFSVAVFWDWRFYRIPNLCIIIGILVGMAQTYRLYTIIGVLGALMDMLIIFAAFYPFYLIHGIGAGDVKLFMMICCFIRGNQLLAYLFATMLLAAVWSGIKMIAYKECRERLFYLGRYLKKTAFTGIIDVYEIDKTQKNAVIRLSIPAFISLILLNMKLY